jgi:hypothetical protein
MQIAPVSKQHLVPNSIRSVSDCFNIAYIARGWHKFTMSRARDNLPSSVMPSVMIPRRGQRKRPNSPTTDPLQTTKQDPRKHKLVLQKSP